MFLRSDEMNYGRAVLNSNWHQAREAEPKDYDLSKAPVRDLRQSSYKQLGTVSNTLPNSTYVDGFTEKFEELRKANEQFPMKKTDRQVEKEMGRSLHARVFMPEHDTTKYPHHYVSTHIADYRAFNSGDSTDSLEMRMRKQREEEEATEAVDNVAVRRCISQFSDTTNHRRSGRNTWQDESGKYANSALKSASRHYAPTYTLMPGGVKP